MSKDLVLKVCMDDEGAISVAFRDDIVEPIRQLGILEWAKAAILETISKDNALAHYIGEDEA